MPHKSLILLIFLFSFFIVRAEEKASGETPLKTEKTEEAKEENDEKKLGIIAFPIVFYSSDTSAGFGASAVLHKEHYKDEYVSKSNSLALVFFYTLRNQMLSANVGNLYWNNANWHWKSKLVFKKYPTDFYGIGNDTKASSHEVFEPFTFQFENSVNRRVWKSFYAGISLTQGYHMLLKKKKDGLAQSYFENHRKEGFISGIGLRLSYDSTDDSFYPTTGSFAEVVWQYHPFWLGSRYSFSRVFIDGRTFIKIPIPKFESVLGFQLNFEGVHGNTPLSFLPTIGSKDIMRGYIGDRFRDNYMLAVQTEWRFPIYWRFGGTLFFAAGKVQHNFTDFIFQDIKYGGGFGIRVRLAKKKKINLRFDMGFTPEGYKFYFNLLEAF
ncbi:BamA/TamA family outer membrane protein [bacterium]|nr:BamA/TamA family outer membrane protein [bacterium]